MPIISNPSRVLMGGVQQIQNTNLAQQRGSAEFTGLTEETIASVSGNGLYTIENRSEQLTTTGIERPIQVGDIVVVAWKGGVPQVIVSHTARRAKHVPPIGNPAIPVVEELFLTDTTIWFRNATQFTPLLPNLTGDAGKQPIKASDFGLTTMTAVHWGKGDASLICIEGTLIVGLDTQIVWVVARLNRPKANEPFPQDFSIRVSLIKTYNLSTDSATFGTYSVAVNPGGHLASGTLKYINATLTAIGAPDTPVNATVESVAPTFQGLTPNGDLLVTVSVAGTATGTGVAQVAFVLGSLLINVAKSVILANHLAAELSTEVFINQTPAASPSCGSALGVATISASAGGAVATAGQVTVLSLTDGKKDVDTGTFNNYALLGPAYYQGGETLFFPPPGFIFCYPARANLTLSVIGEYACSILTFPGTSLGPSQSLIPIFQGSRTMLLFGTFTENGDVSGPLRIVWLPTNTISVIANSLSSDSFDSAAAFFPFFPQQWLQARSLYVTQASQVYTPRETLPYTFPSSPPISVVLSRPNFIATTLNKSTGVMSIDMTKVRSALNGKGFITKPKVGPQQNVVTGFPLSDLQVIDSKTLGAAFQSGPL